jgi:hypothetical protein
MLALATTVLLLLYVVLPATLFRFSLSLLFRTKKRPRSRTEEVTLAILVSGVPLQVARWIAFRHSPFSLFNCTPTSRTDYKTLLDTVFQDAGPLGQEFWSALARVAWQQWTFLRWFYLLVVVEALALGLVLRYAGALLSRRREREGRGRWRWLTDAVTFVVERALSRVILPNISEWDAFFNTRLHKGTPHVDVVTSEDLHRGQVADYFLDDDGKLSGLCLKSAQRFRRERYRDTAEGNKEKSSEDYWKAIPGDLLYIAAENIVNINLRYVEDTVIVNEVPFTVEVRSVPGLPPEPEPPSAETSRISDERKA